MNAQQEAVALFKFLEARGFSPSVRSIARALRDQDVAFRESSLREWLAPFIQRRDASQSHAVATGTQKTSTGDAVGTQADATGTQLHAHNNVSLASKLVEPSDATHPQSPALFLVEPVAKPAAASKPIKTKAVRAPYVPPPCPDDLPDLIPSGEPAALREMAVAFVASFANATGDKAGKHIGSYATMLAKAAGRRRTTAETWDACGIAREIDGGKPLFMGTCNRALDHLTFRKWDEPMPGDDDDTFITGADRVAMGELPPITSADIMPWERPPFHPDYAPQVAHG